MGCEWLFCWWRWPGFINFYGAGLGHGLLSILNGSTVGYVATSPFSLSEEFEMNHLAPGNGI